MADILVVDDEESIATAFQHFLRHEGHDFRIAGNTEDALLLLAERAPDVVIMDIRMPGRDGLQALQEMRRRFPDVYVVMMTAYGTSQTSIDAIRAGAFDYLTKPLDLDTLRSVIAKALTAQRVRSKASAAAAATDTTATSPGPRLVGETPAMQEVYKLIGRLATNDASALVVGEQGTGKGLVAKTIHDNSARSARPFTSIDCAVVTEVELEAILFGDDCGTIHLAKVDALAPALQRLLERALSDQQVLSVMRPPVGARVIASTSHRLVEDVRSGSFSRELHDALAVVTISLRPLRERRADIPALVSHFVHRFDIALNRTIKGVDDAVSNVWQNWSWPGNVGELERAVQRACIVAKGDVITADDIGEAPVGSGFDRHEVESRLASSVRQALHERLLEKSPGPAASAFHDIVDTVESILVEETLVITKGNQLKAAELLGVNRATLRKKIPPEA